MATAVEHSDVPVILGNEETEITVTCQTEYPQYAYNKAEDIWTLVTLKAPCHEDETQRAPIDIVAVIDKSGSMAGQKLTLVKKTLEFFITQLKECDRLAVITYDTHVYVDFGLMAMSKENKARCSAKIQDIRDGSSTNLSGGLLKGLCQIIDRDANKNEVASVLLFTDGLANSGITSAAGIVAAMKDPKKFDHVPSGPQQPARHQSWLQKITGKTPEKAAVDKPTAATPGRPAAASVYTFGFGNDHDPSMLTAISDAGNGMYYFIENQDKIAESFGHCLGGLLSTVGQSINMDVSIKDGALIKEVHVHRPFEISEDKKSVKVNMGDLQSEEARDVVLKLSIDALPIPREETPQPLFDVVANYFNVVTSDVATAVGHLGVVRTTVADHVTDERNVEIYRQKYRIEASAAIAQATDLADKEMYDEAQVCLNQVIDKSDNASQDQYFLGVCEDLRKCSSNVTSKGAWMKGKKSNMNMMQMHQQQRSSAPAPMSEDYESMDAQDVQCCCEEHSRMAKSGTFEAVGFPEYSTRLIAFVQSQRLDQNTDHSVTREETIPVDWILHSAREDEN
eukprot:gene10279-11335_t